MKELTRGAELIARLASKVNHFSEDCDFMGRLSTSGKSMNLHSVWQKWLNDPEVTDWLFEYYDSTSSNPAEALKRFNLWVLELKDLYAERENAVTLLNEIAEKIKKE